ncbi:MAG: MlaD family protein [Planctomycetota bacterium]
MKAITRDTLTGLTAMTSTVALIALLTVFGELSRVGQTFYEVRLRLDTARGLTGTSPVTVHGVRVGQIRELTTAENPAEGVDVVIEIRGEVSIPEDFGVYIERGLISGSALELVVDRTSTAAPVEPGARYAREAGGLFKDLQAQVEGPLARLADNADRVGRLAETYDELGQDLGSRLNALLGPATPDEVDAGAPATIPSTLARIDRAAASAESLLADEELRASLRERLEEAGETISIVRDAAAKLAEAGDGTARVIDEASAAIETLNAASEQARQLLAGINEGEGTAGRLAQDPALYDSLDHSAKELEAVLRDARLLIEKFREEGVPINF